MRIRGLVGLGDGAVIGFGFHLEIIRIVDTHDDIPGLEGQFAADIGELLIIHLAFTPFYCDLFRAILWSVANGTASFLTVRSNPGPM